MVNDQGSLGNGVTIHQLTQLSSTIIPNIPISVYTHDETNNISLIITSNYGTTFTFTRHWEPGMYLVNIEFQSKQVQGVAFHIRGEQFGVFRVPQSFEPEVENIEKYVEIRNAKDLLNLCVNAPVGKLLLDADEIIDRFSMTPPQVEEVQPENALTFIQSRYYTTLYSLKNPLSYFPKTALARLRILCKEDINEIVQILKCIFVNIELLDKRHTGPKGLLSNQIEITSFEKENQSLFLQAHPEFNNEKFKDKVGQLILDLKIREAQLQILVIFEILYTLGINEEEFLNTNSAKLEKFRRKREKEFSKRSLIRPRKGNKKKIVPTFLGMGVEVAETSESTQEKEIDEIYEYYTTLNNLIDRMGLWDALTSSKNNNNYGFMAYVVVPYYNKKLPHLVKYLVDNIKGSNMKLVSKPSKKSKKKETSEEVHTLKQKHSKFKKILLEKHPPKLRNSSTFTSDLTELSNQDDFLPSLKRSQSNLSSKSLKRRQVDLNVKPAIPVDQGPSEQPSFIFGNAKRSKSLRTTEPTLATKSFSQIESTPIKKPKSIIEATPQKKRQIDHAVLETPTTFLKPGKRDHEVKSTPLVAATPQKRSPIKSPLVIEKTPSQKVNSSPIKEVTSSTKRKRPGEPIPFEDSPFYTAGLFNRSKSFPVGQQLFNSDSE